MQSGRLYSTAKGSSKASSGFPPLACIKFPFVSCPRYEGKTPAIADKEARQLMNLSHDKTLKGLRDRALLATLLYHGLRREELCKGNKTRYIPLHAGTQELLNNYLDEARYAADTEGALFRPVSNNRTGELDTITSDGVYKLVRRYALALGLKIGAHALRATAATNDQAHLGYE